MDDLLQMMSEDFEFEADEENVEQNQHEQPQQQQQQHKEEQQQLQHKQQQQQQQQQPPSISITPTTDLNLAVTESESSASSAIAGGTTISSTTLPSTKRNKGLTETERYEDGAGGDRKTTATKLSLSPLPYSPLSVSRVSMGNTTAYYSADEDVSWIDTNSPQHTTNTSTLSAQSGSPGNRTLREEDSAKEIFTPEHENKSPDMKPFTEITEHDSEDKIREHLANLELQAERLRKTLEKKTGSISSSASSTCGTAKAVNGPQGTSGPVLVEAPVDFFASESRNKKHDAKTKKDKIPSYVHAGDTSSSDDEVFRNPGNEVRLLSEEGRYLRKKLYKKHEVSTFVKNSQTIQTPSASGSRITSAIESPVAQFGQSSSKATSSSHPQSTLLPPRGAGQLPKNRNPIPIPNDAKGANVSSSSSKPAAGLAAFDPYFDIKVRNPKISSMVLSADSLVGEKIRLSDLRVGAQLPLEWITMGVLVHKTPTRTSAKGNRYMIWEVSDLKEIQGTPVKLWLFGNTVEKHWKIQVGTAIVIENAGLMTNDNEQPANAKKEICLKILKSTQLIEVGACPEFGQCSQTRKDGQKCQNFINTRTTSVCAFHLLSASKKICAKRGELHSTATNGPVRSWEQRVLGSNRNTTTVFYGGQSITAYNTTRKKTTLTLEAVRKGQKMSDGTASSTKSTVNPLFDRLKTPGFGTRNLLKNLENKAKAETEKVTVKEIGPNKVKEATKKGTEFAMEFLKTGGFKPVSDNLKKAVANTSKAPMLGRGFERPKQVSSIASQSQPITKEELAKRRAMAKLRTKGPLPKLNPNPFDKNSRSLLLQADKRPRTATTNAHSTESHATGSERRESCNESNGSVITTPAKKRAKLGEIDLNDADIQAIRHQTSSHDHEAEEEEARKEETYFRTMEAKETVETNCVNLVEMKDCNVITCKKCVYTWHVQSEHCKQQGHLIQRHKAPKRFFKCQKCSTRTVAYVPYPTKPCAKCGEKVFLRTGMKDERKGPQLPSEQLKVRGEERKFVGS